MNRFLGAALCWLLIADFALAQQQLPDEVVVGARFIEQIIASKNVAEISTFKLAKVNLLPASQKNLSQIRTDVQQFARQRMLDGEILAYDQEVIARDQGNQKILYRLSDEIGDVMFLKVHILHKVTPPTITEIEIITPKEATNHKKGFRIKTNAE